MEYTILETVPSHDPYDSAMRFGAILAADKGVTNLVQEHSEGKYAHSTRGPCWSCAPFWEYFPACPHCGMKLGKRGRTKCPGCKQFVMVAPREDPHDTH